LKPYKSRHTKSNTDSDSEAHPHPNNTDSDSEAHPHPTLILTLILILILIPGTRTSDMDKKHEWWLYECSAESDEQSYVCVDTGHDSLCSSSIHDRRLWNEPNSNPNPNPNHQFMTGVYGMNFKYMPELDYQYSYAIFWAGCFLLSAGMYIYFKLKKWL